MTTLNARANQAWAQVSEDPAEVNYAFEHQRAAFEEGWETGYKTREAEIQKAFERTLYASDDGTEFEHSHPVDEGEPECPACWVQHIRQILGGAS